ncbi:nicotinate-nucleotide adenylyltransferase [Marinobacter lacisalsi]|uniref:Probable nicotinate-nucleotide adenylyltransferase n=1 Tax=Marinobacter lacisalsi TaxID=475979 RepID=A0ABV8QGF5_9GAMM
MHLVYGGTFDPVHNGHLRVAIELMERLEVDCIHLMPCHIPPHRGAPGGSSGDRLDLLNLSVADEPGLRVDGRELMRGGSSYTADTLRQLRQELGPDKPVAIVLGTDAFSSFDRWEEWEQIPELAHIILVRRPQSELAPGSVPERLLAEHRVESVRDLKATPAGGIYEIAPPMLDISATGVRERLEQGRSIRFLVPDAVVTEIKKRGLYAGESGR